MRTYMWALGILIAGCVLVVMGGQKSIVAAKNSEPTRVSYAEWVANPPAAEWLELENVYIDWSASTRIDTERRRRGRVTGVTKEYFVAGWASPDDNSPVKCFFVVNDEAKQRLMEKLWAEDGDAEPPPGAAEILTIRGLVRTGFDLSSEDEKLLRGLANVAPDFKIIDINEEPQGGTGILLVLGGLLGVAGGAGLGLYKLKAARKPAPMPPQPMSGQIPPGPGGPPMSGPAHPPGRPGLPPKPRTGPVRPPLPRKPG